MDVVHGGGGDEQQFSALSSKSQNVCLIWLEDDVLGLASVR